MRKQHTRIVESIRSGSTACTNHAESQAIFLCWLSNHLNPIYINTIEVLAAFVLAAYVTNVESIVSSSFPLSTFRSPILMRPCPPLNEPVAAALSASLRSGEGGIPQPAGMNHILPLWIPFYPSCHVRGQRVHTISEFSQIHHCFLLFCCAREN